MSAGLGASAALGVLAALGICTLAFFSFFANCTVVDSEVDFTMADFEGKDEQFVRDWLVRENFKSSIVTAYEGMCRPALLFLRG